MKQCPTYKPLGTCIKYNNTGEIKIKWLKKVQHANPDQTDQIRIYRYKVSSIADYIARVKGGWCEMVNVSDHWEHPAILNL